VTKRDLYEAMATQLAPLWERDLQLCEAEEASGVVGAWTQARVLDDWLVQYREDDRVSVGQYARNCERFIALYADTVPVVTAPVVTAPVGDVIPPFLALAPTDEPAGEEEEEDA